MDENAEMTCKACGRKFTPSNFTKHVQIHCTRVKCVKARERAKRKKWNDKMRMENEDEWRLRTNKYSSDSRRRKREREMAEAKDALNADMRKGVDPPKGMDMIAGVAAYVCGAKTGGELMAFLAKARMRGHKLLASCLGIG